MGKTCLELVKQKKLTVHHLFNAGASLIELTEAGFSDAQLQQEGAFVWQLRQEDVDLMEYLAAGVSVRRLRAMHFSVRRLRVVAGFSIAQLLDAGVSAEKLGIACMPIDALAAKLADDLAAELATATPPR